MGSQDLFYRDGYIVVRNFVNVDVCKKISDYIKHMYEQGGNFRTDGQCPLSDSAYGLPLLDLVLQKLAKNVSSITGTEVLPTYSYTRIYRTGEVLHKHVDRQSCEISLTLTLEYNADTIWPIYFYHNGKEVRASLDVGDAVIYRGTELPHWRNEFIGNYHIQAFFHYVDSTGPYKDYYMDKRSRFGIINKRG